MRKKQGTIRPPLEPNQGCIDFKCTTCNETGIMSAKIRPSNETPKLTGYELRKCIGLGWDNNLYLASMPAELFEKEEEIHQLHFDKLGIPEMADRLGLQCSLKQLAQFIKINKDLDPQRWRRPGYDWIPK